jgi:hypothetical protein
MERIVFTDWRTVIIENVNRREIPEGKFLRYLNRVIKENNCGIKYYSNEKSFVITLYGVDHEVILPLDSQNSLNSKKHTPLVNKLLLISAASKKYNDEYLANEVKRIKIQEIEDSMYEKIETEEDYNLYLDYLKQLLKKAKTKMDKTTINAKILRISELLRNPLNFKLHINRFIYNITKDMKLLDDNDKKEIRDKLLSILNDYFAILNRQNDDNEMLVLGSSTLPMNILYRINEVEENVASLLRKKQKNNNSDGLEDVRDNLNSIIRSGGHYGR